MAYKSRKLLVFMSLLFSALFLAVFSSPLSIMADGLTDYDYESYKGSKATVLDATERNYINKYDVEIQFNLPDSIDGNELLVQYVITDSDTYTWSVDSDHTDNFNDVGVLNFSDTLPYNKNYIHSRVKLYGTDTIYILDIEEISVDTDAPIAGTVTSGYEFGTWTNKSVDVNINDASDLTSDIWHQYYKVTKDGNLYTDWTLYTNEDTPFVLSLTTTGVYTIVTKAQDLAGNESIGTEVEVKIDKEAPTVGNISSSISKDAWTRSDAVLSIETGSETDDNRSGFSHYEIYSVTRDEEDITSNYKVGNSAYDGSEITFINSGKYNIVIRGYDFAGNYSILEHSFGIDKEAQVITVEQTVTGKAVNSAIVIIDTSNTDGYSETAYYYLDGEFDESTFIDGYRLTETFVELTLNSTYSFASIDEVGNIYVTTILIDNIITNVTLSYEGQLSQIVSSITPVTFRATINPDASEEYIYWFVNDKFMQKGGSSYYFKPDETKTDDYLVYATIVSDSNIKSNAFTISVSEMAATFIEIDYEDGALERTYGNNDNIVLNAVVDIGASAKSATWFFNDSLTNFATGQTVVINAENIRNAGVYKVTVYIEGENIYTDSVDIVVSPYEIVITPIATSKIYGEVDPTFEYEIDKDLLYSDVLDGNVGREEGEAEGTYKMNLGDLAEKNPNYKFVLDSTDVFFTINSYDIEVVVNYYGYYNSINQTYKVLHTSKEMVGVNTEYTGQIKEFKGYEVYDGEAVTIKVTADTHTIDYYYTAIGYEITITHVSSRDAMVILAREANKKVYTDQEVIVYTRNITGYSIDQSSFTYTMDYDTREYVIKYNPMEIDVTVNHLGYNSKLLEREVIQSYYGLTINVDYKIYTGYSSPASSYTYTIASTTTNVVNLSYIANKYEITIHHQDEDGNTIHEDTVLKDQLFDSTAELIPLTIDGYISKLEVAEYTITSIYDNEYTFVYRKAIVPIITLIGEDTIRIDIENIVEYTDEKAYVNDYFSINKQIVGVWRNHIAPTYDKIGTFYLDYDYINEDGLKAATVTRKIIIYDATAPIIKIGLEEETIIVGTVYDFYFGIEYSDNYDQLADLKLEYTTDLDTSLIGEYTITYTVTDTSGNSISATRKVFVENAKKAGGSFPIVPVIIGGSIGLLGILFLIIFMIMKKKKKEEQPVINEEPKKIESKKEEVEESEDEGEKK